MTQMGVKLTDGKGLRIEGLIPQRHPQKKTRHIRVQRGDKERYDERYLGANFARKVVHTTPEDVA